MTEEQKGYMKMAIEISRIGMRAGKGGPFGCVIVKDGNIIGSGSNSVLSTNDPTAHAEIVAIREACKTLGDFQLEGCELYTSCEPCPMCLGAIYWARPARVFYANTKKDAAEAGFDDQFIYEELQLPYNLRKIPFEQGMQESAKEVFQEWILKEDKTLY
ncbi:nucleoside deaminase [Cecembia rubra]|uniref:tRNA(Arg) A34 adenosine deaminase TadA n=1 Tax=Cecembia rubra TaxID=1485585 RepID=A0A2P8E6H6_9BACT|nr:nucleoside deaminase [Cecembia rubra]PSL05056.1 tRNA(Arg) A34 adenosine deaminase TadA [Cecembia rubra]